MKMTDNDNNCVDKDNENYKDMCKNIHYNIS